MLAIFRPRYQPKIFVTVMLLFYSVIPFFLYMIDGDMVFLRVSALGVLSCVGIVLGFMVAAEYKNNIFRLTTLTIDPGWYVFAVFLIFISFVIVTLVSANSIPLFLALSDKSPQEIAVSRELFLKARTGWQVGLVYINSLLSGVLLPFALVLAFVERYKIRKILLVCFLLYSILFLEKAFFLRAALPLLALYAVVTTRNKPVSNFLLVLSIPAIFLLNISISGFGGSENEIWTFSFTNFFSAGFAQHATSDPLIFLIWRIFAVPVFTSFDSIRVFMLEMGGNLQLGSTSSLISTLFGIPRVAFERMVFEYQWGQNLTGTGSSNAVFFIEAYVNYGYFGVLIVSSMVGMILYKMAFSRSIAVASITPLFAFSVFTGGFFGLLFSNGYILFFVIAMMIKRRKLVKGLMF